MSAAQKQRFSPGVWLIIPLLLVMAAGFNLPLLTMLGKSFFGDGGFTLSNYASLIEIPVYMKVLGNTLKISVLTTIFCVLLGYPLTYWLRGLSPKWQMVGLAAIVIPFWISILVR